MWLYWPIWYGERERIFGIIDDWEYERERL